MNERPVTQTATDMSTHLIQHLSSPPIQSFLGFVCSSRPTSYSTAVLELMGFQKGTKREIAAYPTLTDERDFDSFSRSFFYCTQVK